MFDSAPPNLPVEPTPSAPPVKPIAPAPAPGPGPRPVPAAPMSSKGKKEPEDIFSDLDVASDQQAANAGVMESHPAPKRNPLIIVGIVVVAVLILGAAGYLVWTLLFNKPTPTVATPQASQTTTPPVRTEQPPVTQQPTPVVQPTDQTAQQVPAQNVPAPVTQPPPGSNIPLPVPTPPAAPTTGIVPAPAVTVAEGADSDEDALMNVEEPLYGTDPSLADTDGDGFSDGAEVMNLFSPVGKGESITKDPKIAVVLWNAWSMLLPNAMSLTAGQDPSAATISTPSQTTFTLQTQANASHQTLAAWIGANASDMKAFTTKNGLAALQTSDGLTTYLSAGDTILIVGYQLNGDTSYEYRTTYALLVNSLRPPKP